MIIGTYGTPPLYGGSASANEYSTIDELLIQLPDNNANEIDAVNVRNSVYTLWERISYVEIIASQSASASSIYTNLTPTVVSIGGIQTGSTFSNSTMKQMWDLLLYPYVAPLITLSASNLIGEFGGGQQITLNYSVYKKSDTITSIKLYRNASLLSTFTGAPFTSNQIGSTVSTAVALTNTTFTLTADDGTSTSSTSVIFNWYSAVYIGTYFTFSAPPMTIVGVQPSWANGASINSGKSVTSSFVGSYDGIDGNGEYLVFAWPSSYGYPTFKVDGIVNTAFTKIIDAQPHTNVNGYITNYDVWMSNTAQNLPITYFEIK